jgi:hypothetical protein
MGSQLRRLRVKAGIVGGFNRSKARVAVPKFHNKALDISFVDDLPNRLALMPDRDFSDGMDALRSELQTLLSQPDYQSRVEAFGSELGQRLSQLAVVSPYSREEVAEQLQFVLRVLADSAEKEDR